MDIDTPHGPARVHLDESSRPAGLLVLGHGAGGGVGSPDLVAAAETARSAGFTVARVEQPYRVAGRRTPSPAPQLDAAWLAVVSALRRGARGRLAVVVGGRSSGARVACRTAEQAGASGVLCLAFPVHPPGRADDPSKSRLPELDAVPVPVLVIQGERDPFGMPPSAPARTVVTVPGTHSLRTVAPIRSAVADWLATVVPARGAAASSAVVQRTRAAPA
jgi:predicted alpha/beta-hydrolase family hydrolase